MSKKELDSYKGKTFFDFWEQSLAMADLRLFDSCLERISQLKPDQREIEFKGGEFEKIIGVGMVSEEDVDFLVSKIMTVFEVWDTYTFDDSRFALISLFEEGTCYQDSDGTWEVNLLCTKTAKKYLFTPAVLPYLRYGVNRRIGIENKYTYALFLYLWDNRYRGTWSVEVPRLKEIIGCQSEELYQEFDVFELRILKNPLREIEKVVGVKCDYKLIKKKRAIVGIQFCFDPLQPALSSVECFEKSKLFCQTQTPFAAESTLQDQSSILEEIGSKYFE